MEIKELNKNIEERLTEMEKSDYCRPAPFQKRDYLLAAGVGILCLLGLVAGGFLS